LQFQNIPITSEYITLGQLLKFAGIIGSGGEAKDFLESGQTLVNGEPEARRGRKIYPGDVVVLPEGNTIRVSSQ
jgi:S4 domain protein YaaA